MTPSGLQTLKILAEYQSITQNELAEGVDLLNHSSPQNRNQHVYNHNALVTKLKQNNSLPYVQWLMNFYYVY